MKNIPIFLRKKLAPASAAVLFFGGTLTTAGIAVHEHSPVNPANSPNILASVEAPTESRQADNKPEKNAPKKIFNANNETLNSANLATENHNNVSQSATLNQSNSDEPQQRNTSAAATQNNSLQQHYSISGVNVDDENDDRTNNLEQENSNTSAQARQEQNISETENDD